MRSRSVARPPGAPRRRDSTAWRRRGFPNRVELAPEWNREIEVPKEDLDNGLKVDMADQGSLVLDRIHRLVVVGLAEIPEDFIEEEPLVVAKSEDLA